MTEYGRTLATTAAIAMATVLPVFCKDNIVTFCVTYWCCQEAGQGQGSCQGLSLYVDQFRGL